MTNTQSQPQRLLSLDILRGFDLFMLVFFQPVLGALGRKIDSPMMNSILYHFNHEEWVGFRAWDLVMPLFLFMAGVAIPFALSKYRNGGDKIKMYKRILRRVILLFILGAIVQGNLLGLDIHKFYPYSNTLQAIAVGYLITAVLVMNFSIKGQLIGAGILMLLYWIPMTFLGDFTPEGNFAEAVDQFVLERFRDGTTWNPGNDSWSPNPHYHYTWILSSLTFGVTTLMGAFAGHIVKNGTNRNKNALTLLVIGVACIAVSLIWSLQMPIIKKIWTCTMVLYSGGICFLLLALFYYIIDCRNYSKGLMWLKVYGMNSITAYVIGMTVDFGSVVSSVSYGLEQFFNEYYSVWITFGNFMIVFIILKIMYDRGIFLKV